MATINREKLFECQTRAVKFNDFELIKALVSLEQCLDDEPKEESDTAKKLRLSVGELCEYLQSENTRLKEMLKVAEDTLTYIAKINECGIDYKIHFQNHAESTLRIINQMKEEK